MVAYVIFIKERTHNQGELDLYKEMAPAALAGHPITFRIAHGHKEVVEGPDFEDVMMLEFPTFREARAWYDSPAYQAAKANIGSKVPIIALSSLKASRPNSRGFPSCAKSCMTRCEKVLLEGGNCYGKLSC